MKATRALRGLTAKMLAVSTVLLVGIGTAAAAGALPGTAQHTTAAIHSTAVHSAAVHSAAPPQVLTTGISAGAQVNAALAGVGQVSAGGGVHLPASTASSAATVGSGAGVAVKVGAAGVHAALHVGTGGLGTGGSASIAGDTGSGAAGTISGITSSLTNCLSGLISASTGQPLLALNSVIPTVVTCVKNVIAGLPVPTAVSTCISSLLTTLSGLPFVGSGSGVIDLTGCVPIDLTTCIQAALNSIGGLLGGSTGVNNIPSVLDTCATSIVNGVVNLVNSLLGQVTGTLGGVTGVPGSVSLGTSTKSSGGRR